MRFPVLMIVENEFAYEEYTMVCIALKTVILLRCCASHLYICFPINAILHFLIAKMNFFFFLFSTIMLVGLVVKFHVHEIQASLIRCKQKLGGKDPILQMHIFDIFSNKFIDFIFNNFVFTSIHWIFNAHLFFLTHSTPSSPTSSSSSWTRTVPRTGRLRWPDGKPCKSWWKLSHVPFAHCPSRWTCSWPPWMRTGKRSVPFV